jgi:hypothetical protein
METAAGGAAGGVGTNAPPRPLRRPQVAAAVPRPLARSGAGLAAGGGPAPRAPAREWARRLQLLARVCVWDPCLAPAAPVRPTPPPHARHLAPRARARRRASAWGASSSAPPTSPCPASWRRAARSCCAAARWPRASPRCERTRASGSGAHPLRDQAALSRRDALQRRLAMARPRAPACATAGSWRACAPQDKRGMRTPPPPSKVPQTVCAAVELHLRQHADAAAAGVRRWLRQTLSESNKQQRIKREARRRTSSRCTRGRARPPKKGAGAASGARRQSSARNAPAEPAARPRRATRQAPAASAGAGAGGLAVSGPAAGRRQSRSSRGSAWRACSAGGCERACVDARRVVGPRCCHGGRGRPSKRGNRRLHAPHASCAAKPAPSPALWARRRPTHLAPPSSSCARARSPPSRSTLSARSALSSMALARASALPAPLSPPRSARACLRSFFCEGRPGKVAP